MNQELVINSTPNEVVIALLHDKRLVELHREKDNSKFSVGDIYLGRHENKRVKPLWMPLQPLQIIWRLLCNDIGNAIYCSLPLS